jgi:hypothetical protein
LKFVLISLMKLSGLLGFLGLCSCAAQAPQAAADPWRELAERIGGTPEPAVLFVGNSYSFALPQTFKKLAAGRGKKVRVGHSTYGGWTLAQHAAHEATLRKIRGGRWDVVVLQEQSLIPALPERRRDKEMSEPLRLLVAEVRQQGAVPLLYQTWGRRDGDPELPNDDFQAMTQRLRAGYQSAARSVGGIQVVPVGDAWEREFLAGDGQELFVEDGSHPSVKGSELTARVFFETLFNP